MFFVYRIVSPSNCWTYIKPVADFNFHNFFYKDSNFIIHFLLIITGLKKYVIKFHVEGYIFRSRGQSEMETDLFSRGGVPKSGFSLGILGFLLGNLLVATTYHMIPLY